MRVAFDEQIFLLQRHGGVSRYFVELIQALEGGDLDVSVDLPFGRVWNEHALQAWPGRFRALDGPLQPYRELARAGTRARRRGPMDVVHHTFYQSRFLRDYPHTPKVVTIYDMIPELLGERGKLGNPHMAKREYVRRASAIICISESARRDMDQVYGPPDCPVSVVHLGVDPAFSAGGSRPPGFPPERYLLFVGRRGGYKDFATVAGAFVALATSDPDLWLVCVGGGPLSDDERSSLGVAADRVLQRSLPDADMPGAYANAAAFVFPSRYEGFGLPAVEAMAAGTPAVLANTSSLPEVGGEAALYFDPGDVEALAAVLEGLLGSPAEADRRVTLGRERARLFTWRRTAEGTTQVYRGLKP